jgi:hypothetical protein
MRIRRIALVAAATTVLLGVAGVMSARGEDTQLFGYRMSATASAISFVHDQKSFGIPSDPTFELRHVYSLADLDSGPSGHGLGSVLWPGQVAGNASTSLLFDTVLFNPTQFDQVQETCLPDAVKENIGPVPVPTPLQCYGISPIQQIGRDAFQGRGGYPIRAESLHPQGPAGDSRDVAGGVRMESTAKADEVNASSTTGGAGIPGVITFASIYSRSNSRVEGGKAIAESVAKISDLDLFGAIHIEQMISSLRSESDGLKATNVGSLTIAGMTIKDQEGKEQAKILVDGTGFHMGDKNVDPLGKQAAAIFKKYLEPRGIHLFAGKPSDKGTAGASGVLELSGLTVQLEAKGMNELLDGIDKAAPKAGIKSTLQNPTSSPLSPPIFGDDGVLNPTVAGYVASFFQGDQVESFIFGFAHVESAASPPFSDVVIPPLLPPAFPPALPPVSLPPGGPGFIPPTTNGGGPSTLGPLTPVGVKGIPFTYIALAIAVAAFGATRLRVFADTVMAAPAAVRCPLED